MRVGDQAGGGCWPCPVRENDLLAEVGNHVWEGGTGGEASEAIGQVKLELLAHQNGHAAELDSTGDDRAEFGAEGRREARKSWPNVLSPARVKVM